MRPVQLALVSSLFAFVCAGKPLDALRAQTRLAVQAASAPTSQSSPVSQTDKADDKDKNKEKEKESEDKDKAKEPKPYDKVITKDAKTQRDIFIVHEVNDKYYFEIPVAELNKEFLYAVHLEGATPKNDRGNYLSRVVRWEKHQNKVLLREVRYDVMSSDPQSPVTRAVEDANISPIVMSFDLETESKDGSPVIDATRLFTNDVEELSVKAMLGVGNRDSSRSSINYVHVFPRNIETEILATYPGGSGNPGRGGTATTTVTLRHSMVLLPEHPMMARLEDNRVGYFCEDQLDFAPEDGTLHHRCNVSRWRLEKKDPHAAVSDPVKPITFYIDPNTPRQWIPYIKRAVEAWNSAFETAGFSHAIRAVEAPTKAEDPEWDPGDIRYSVIRWQASSRTNAMGPHITDPRSGEILNAPVVIYQNVLDLAERWYFVQVGPLNPEASRVPFPVDLNGRLIEMILTHEIGHSLGLRHNFKASSLYTIQQIRDPNWVKTMGFTPSIMDYARFNYVAQPEDHMTPDELLPRIGPYDRFAIHWGYADIPTAHTPDDEVPTLNQWLGELRTHPYLAFAPDESMMGDDPGEEVEAIGDSDAVQASEFGLKNLQRAEGMILPAVSGQIGKPYDDMRMLYDGVGR